MEYERMEKLFYRQVEFQKKIVGLPMPTDNPLLFRDHICLLTEEVGELAKTDKRWRQNQSQTKEDGFKLDELADVFIVAMNLTMFSGYDFDDLLNAISDKMNRNEQRLLRKHCDTCKHNHEIGCIVDTEPCERICEGKVCDYCNKWEANI